MARKRSSPVTPSLDPPKRFCICEHCKVEGQVGKEILPYSFAPKDYRWLHREPCFGLAWNSWKAASEPQKVG